MSLIKWTLYVWDDQAQAEAQAPANVVPMQVIPTAEIADLITKKIRAYGKRAEQADAAGLTELAESQKDKALALYWLLTKIKWGGAMSAWTKELPTNPGWYWVRWPENPYLEAEIKRVNQPNGHDMTYLEVEDIPITEYVRGWWPPVEWQPVPGPKE